MSPVDLEADASWLFETFKKARLLETIPITNTRHVVSNKIRDWVYLELIIRKNTKRVMLTRFYSKIGTNKEMPIFYHVSMI